jgi:hypothetical protein
MDMAKTFKNEYKTKFLFRRIQVRGNKVASVDGLLLMSRHHGYSIRQVQVARYTNTSAENNDAKFRRCMTFQGWFQLSSKP